MLGLILGGAGCVAPVAGIPLPERLAATVAFEDGTYGSAYVEMRQPTEPPVVRYAEGPWVVDDASLELVEVRRVPGPEGGRAIVDLLRLPGEERARYDAGPAVGVEPQLLAVQEGALAVAVGSEIRWLDPATGQPLPDRPVELELARSGPGEGFRLLERDGDLRLALPLRDEGVPLFRGVARVVHVCWFPEAPRELEDTIDVHFKAVDVLSARGASARVDGDLSEWRRQAALAVQDPSHLLDGESAWDGAWDASFGVAARLDRGRLFLAIRIRDDDLAWGHDAVEVEVDGRTWRVPIERAGLPVHREDGLEFAFTDAVSWGTGLELSLPMSGPPPVRTALPVVVRYLDVDEKDAVATRLATAPGLHALALHVAGATAGL